MKDIRGQTLLYSRPSALFPDILFTQQKKEYIQQLQSTQRFRRESQPNIQQRKCISPLDNSNQLNSFEHPLNPSFTTPLNQEKIYTKIQRTRSLFERIQKVESTQNMYQYPHNKALCSENLSLRGKKNSFIAPQIQNLNDFQKESECNELFESGGRTSKHFKKKSLQFSQLITPIDKRLYEGELGIQSYTNKLDPASFTNYLSETKRSKQSNSNNQYRGTCISNFGDSHLTSPRRQFLKKESLILEKEGKFEQSYQSKRSASDHINELKPKQPVPPQTQMKINFIKQFTIKTVNNRNQNMFIETNPSFSFKSQMLSQQSPKDNQQLNSLSPRGMLYQNETQTFQAKLSKYIQHLKLMQTKRSQQYCDINFTSYQQQKCIPSANLEFKQFKQKQKNLRQDLYLKKLEQQLKQSVDQSYQSFNQNISKQSSLHQTPLKNNSPKSKQDKVNLKGRCEKEDMDQIPLCPFNQFNQNSNVSLQFSSEQAYLDDLDLCQYVQKNIKLSS